MTYKNIDIYTDGACSGNPGPGGWAFVVIIDGELTAKKSGGEKNTTNNKMELTAVIKAFEFLLANDIPTSNKAPKVYTDSKYVQQGISDWIHNWKKNNWRTSQKKPVKNQELWQSLDCLANQINPQWLWVKAHNNNEYNELCDKMAVAESKKT
ncbi:MAG: ribonuclease HI [Treponema sp.]|nr:MAG: ribonuclease HI [Treponema sp.]